MFSILQINLTNNSLNKNIFLPIKYEYDENDIPYII